MTFIDTTLLAVGHVRSEVTKVSIPFRDNDLHLDQRVQARQGCNASICEIIIEKTFEDCLDGIEDFSHIIVIFLTDTPEEARKTIKKIHPAGVKEAPLKGIFSSRSPIRPNPLALSTVKLVKRKKNILEVEGFDAVDKTVILDIKPFIGSCDAPENSTSPPWVLELEKKFHQH